MSIICTCGKHDRLFCSGGIGCKFEGQTGDENALRKEYEAITGKPGRVDCLAEPKLKCTSRCARSTGICDGWEGCARSKEERPTKYYFISTMYRYRGQQDFKPQHQAEDRHPFEVISHYNKTQPGTDIVLLSWREITREEYELYNKLEL